MSLESESGYNYPAHRKACIAQAVEDGYLDSPKEARYYDLCDDGKFHLKTDQFHWFSTNISLYDFEAR